MTRGRAPTPVPDDVIPVWKTVSPVVGAVDGSSMSMVVVSTVGFGLPHQVDTAENVIDCARVEAVSLQGPVATPCGNVDPVVDPPLPRVYPVRRATATVRSS